MTLDIKRPTRPFFCAQLLVIQRNYVGNLSYSALSHTYFNGSQQYLGQKKERS